MNIALRIGEDSVFFFVRRNYEFYHKYCSIKKIEDLKKQ